ncbi:7-cyano-7-deazaguanine synthase QueC [Vulcanisaeta souniana]|uniref:7-cyano-7-deazaguanine synthase n=1 Tax=Vulcanisaeta souniana JCM 11219 TaxID=1293586 RepID=A0A830E7A0_9CREN|nr:7-cyano-7-deazaguanine synthase QueC [Vulcanisaeta souniana]BDR93237.1 7-cyano-7-deazaguanine synthase [Vulcanisaeta souniana JCM 11219]GGI78652.1 7-cyano-7-deazaguanine synthase [Vulcanisaeta souniana JCM 11219]
MCTIGGVLIFGDRLDRDRAKRIEEVLRMIIVKGEERGRDSFGIVALDKNGELNVFKSRDRPSIAVSRMPSIINENTVAVIFNNRAEPTTEYVRAKTEDDIQPMIGEHVVVAHNGTIANDKDLETKFNLTRRSRIDTAILPPLLERLWDGSLNGLRDALINHVIGSYALAIMDTHRPGRVWFVTNFKPLYMAWYSDLKALFFASLDDYLIDDQGRPIWDTPAIRRVEPYTAMEVGVDGTWSTVSLRREEQGRRRVLVIASGGLDSTTAATYLLRQGYDVTLLHFNYGHRAETQEDRAVRRIVEFLGVPLLEINMDFFRVVRHSPLLGDGEINRIDRGREGAEFAHEWVPARNFVFIALATAIAEAYGFDYIATGINLEEAGAYPDNEMEFIRLLNKVMPYAVGPNKHVELIMPVGHLVKHEIVRLGLETGAPLHLTWSCYDNGEKHCGRCGPCYMRRWAFKINGVRDPVEYDLPSEAEEEFWRGTRLYEAPKKISR